MVVTHRETKLQLVSIEQTMTDSWAAYKNEEEEVSDFVEWIGGTAANWTERESENGRLSGDMPNFFSSQKAKKISIKGREQTGTYNGGKV